MCHLSIKLSDMFDPNPMYTSDKTSDCGKTSSVKETPLSLTLSTKVKVIAIAIIHKGTVGPNVERDWKCRIRQRNVESDIESGCYIHL